MELDGHNAAELFNCPRGEGYDVDLPFLSKTTFERSSLIPSATHNAAHDYERAMPHTMVSTSANLQQFFSVFNDVPCCKQLIISICNTLSVYLSFSGCTSR